MRDFDKLLGEYKIAKQNNLNTEESNCELCHDSGWIVERTDGMLFATPCKCHEKLKLNRRIKFATLPDAFKDMELKTFTLSCYVTEDGKQKAKIACKIIKEWLSDFDEMKNKGKGLYIFSETKGSGKTRIVASIANELMKKMNTPVKFATSVQILNEIRKTYQKESTMSESDLINDLKTVPVLIIDDFGTEKITDWAKEKFYDIINYRYIEKKITIFTSNESLDSIRYDDRVTSRIKEMCYQIDFPEESVRDRIADLEMKEMLNKVISK